MTMLFCGWASGKRRSGTAAVAGASTKRFEPRHLEERAVVERCARGSLWHKHTLWHGTVDRGSMCSVGTILYILIHTIPYYMQVAP